MDQARWTSANVQISPQGHLIHKCGARSHYRPCPSSGLYDRLQSASSDCQAATPEGHLMLSLLHAS